VTKVPKPIRYGRLFAVCFALAATSLAWTQDSSQKGSAEALYLQLRSVGLDKARVYQIREALLDRAGFHFTFGDGVIAFTEDVMGRVTGAFFEGDGELLLIPPDQVERASMTLFTGAAILEERFDTAYFRFNDQAFAELQPFLRPTENAEEFVSQWNPAAQNLAQGDALRLLLTFSQFLPVSGQAPAKSDAGDDRMLHARLQGRKLGAFDLYFDSKATEQVWAGQMRTVEGESYFDVWAAFSPTRAARNVEISGNANIGPDKGDALNISGYRIRTEVRPPTQLNCEAALQMEVRQGGQRAVLFELSRFLHIKQVLADGRPLEFIQNQALEGTQLARRGNDLLAVVFPRLLQSGERLELRFSYGGEVLSEAGGGLL
jgi:hypothetical protein